MAVVRRSGVEATLERPVHRLHRGRLRSWTALLAGAAGIALALLLPFAPFVPVTESGVTGAVLGGLAIGWLLLGLLATRRTGALQACDFIAAAFFAVSGVLLLTLEPRHTGSSTGSGQQAHPVPGRLIDVGATASTCGAPVRAARPLYLLGLVFGTLALAISAATGHSAMSRAVAAAVAVVAYVVNGLAPLVDRLEPLRKLSPFYQYVGHDPLRTGLNGPAILVSCGTVAVLLVIAVLGFRRRDVPG